MIFYSARVFFVSEDHIPPPFILFLFYDESSPDGLIEQ